MAQGMPTWASTAAIPARLRSACAIVATSVFGVLAGVALLSFVPGVATDAWFGWVVAPCFLLIFPLWAVMFWDLSTRRDAPSSRRRRGSDLGLKGWRATAAGVLFAAGFVVALSTLVFGGPSASDADRPKEQASTATDVKDVKAGAGSGEDDAGGSRWFAGIAMVFAGTAALRLGQPLGEDDDGETVPAVPREPRSGLAERYQRLAGRREVTEAAPDGVDDVIARLSAVVPVRVVGRRPSGAAELYGEWDVPKRWPSPTFPVRFDAVVSPGASGGAVLHGTVRPATRAAASQPLASLGSVLFLALAGALIAAGVLPSLFVLFLPVWVTGAAFGVYTQVSNGRRAACLVRR